MISVEEALTQWGCWVRSGRQLPGLADTQRRQSGPSTSLTDDEAQAIDRAVAQLKHRDSEMGRAVFGYHCTTLPIRSLAKILDVGETKATQLLKSGQAWIDCYLQITISQKRG